MSKENNAKFYFKDLGSEKDNRRQIKISMQMYVLLLCYKLSMISFEFD